MEVPLLDLKKQFAKIRDEIMEATEDVYRSQYFILGPKVADLEKRVAEYCGCRFAVGVSSGTDALLISIMTAGIGVDDLVITTPYTFFATVGSICRVGARPLFVDIDGGTYNMDPLKLEKLISSLDSRVKSRLKAIIPVHLFGQCVDMAPVLEIAEKNELIVIEDAAQAIGAEFQFGDGKIKSPAPVASCPVFSIILMSRISSNQVTSGRSQFVQRGHFLVLYCGSKSS